MIQYKCPYAECEGLAPFKTAQGGSQHLKHRHGGEGELTQVDTPEVPRSAQESPLSPIDKGVTEKESIFTAPRTGKEILREILESFPGLSATQVDEIVRLCDMTGDPPSPQNVAWVLEKTKLIDAAKQLIPQKYSAELQKIQLNAKKPYPDFQQPVRPDYAQPFSYPSQVQYSQPQVQQPLQSPQAVLQLEDEVAKLREKYQGMEVRLVTAAKDHELRIADMQRESLQMQLDQLKKEIRERPSGQDSLTLKLDGIEKRLEGGPKSLFDFWSQFKDQKNTYKEFSKEVLGMADASLLKNGKPDHVMALIEKIGKPLEKFVDNLVKDEKRRSDWVPPPAGQFKEIAEQKKREEDELRKRELEILKQAAEEKKRLEDERDKLAQEILSPSAQAVQPSTPAVELKPETPAEDKPVPAPADTPAQPVQVGKKEEGKNVPRSKPRKSKT